MIAISFVNDGILRIIISGKIVPIFLLNNKTKISLLKTSVVTDIAHK